MPVGPAVAPRWPGDEVLHRFDELLGLGVLGQHAGYTRLESGLHGVNGGMRGEEVSTQQQIPMSPPVALRPEFNLIAQVNGRALMDAFETVRSEHPELLLNDDELRQWLETDILPEIPTGEARPLWLTIESPRVGVKKLKAHVAVNLVVNP